MAYQPHGLFLQYLPELQICTIHKLVHDLRGLVSILVYFVQDRFSNRAWDIDDIGLFSSMKSCMLKTY